MNKRHRNTSIVSKFASKFRLILIRIFTPEVWLICWLYCCFLNKLSSFYIFIELGWYFGRFIISSGCWSQQDFLTFFHLSVSYSQIFEVLKILVCLTILLLKYFESINNLSLLNRVYWYLYYPKCCT